MEKLNYQLSMISSLIVSPRGNMAWYKELDEFTPDKIPNFSHLDKKRLKIVYPFYQYGEYEKWTKDASHYLPGSSVKGAILSGTDIGYDIKVDDIEISNESITMRNLYKVQYLEEPHKAGLSPFFENVGVEMVRAETKLNGELYLKQTENVEELLNQANRTTIKKINRMAEYIAILLRRDYSEELKTVLNNAEIKLNSLCQDNNVILLGGYKGLLHSIEVKDSISADIKKQYGAIFLDPATGLPHGLARIKIEDS